MTGGSSKTTNHAPRSPSHSPRRAHGANVYLAMSTINAIPQAPSAVSKKNRSDLAPTTRFSPFMRTAPTRACRASYIRPKGSDSPYVTFAFAGLARVRSEPRPSGRGHHSNTNPAAAHAATLPPANSRQPTACPRRHQPVWSWTSQSGSGRNSNCLGSTGTSTWMSPIVVTCMTLSKRSRLTVLTMSGMSLRKKVRVLS